MESKTIGTIILVAYFVLFWLFAFGSYKFTKNTVSRFQAPKGTMVRETEDLANSLMTDQIFHNPLFFIVNNKDSNDPVVWPNMSVSDAPLCRIGNFIEQLRLDPSLYHTPEMYSVKWYCKFIQFPDFARNLVSADNRTGLIAIDLHGSLLGGAGNGGGPVPVINAVKKFVNSADTNLSHVIDIKSTSVVEVFDDLKNGLLGDLLRIDSVAVPLAVAALALCLRSMRMTVIPLPSILLSVTLTFALMYPISIYYPVSSFAPEFVMGGLLALTVDFSLFLGSRFRERIALAKLQNKDLTDPDVRTRIVRDTAVLTSHNIIVSGLAVAVALGMLLIVPIGTVATIGGAYALGAIVTIFVALTFQPAMMLVFFDFFSHDPCVDKVFEWCPCVRKLFGDDFTNLNNDDADADGDIDASCYAEDGGHSLPNTSSDNISNNYRVQQVSDLTAQEQAGDTSKNPSGSLASSTPNVSGGISGSTPVKKPSDQSPPSYRTMFQKQDLIQYRSSGANMSQTMGSQAVFDHPSGHDDATVQVINNTTANKKSGYGQKLLASHADHVARKAQYRSIWFRLGRWVIQYPFWTLLIVGALASPFIYLAFQTKITFDMFLQVPTDSPHVATLFEVSDKIGTGSLSDPFYVTIDTKRENGIAEYKTYPLEKFNITKNVTTLIFNATVWAKFQELTRHVSEIIGQDMDTLSSIVSPPKVANFSTIDAEALLLCTEFEIHTPLTQDCFEYQLLYNHSVDASRRMGLIIIAPKYNPFGINAYDYVASIERAVTTFDSQGLFDMGFFGASATSYSILHKMTDLLPLQFGLMFVVIFTVIFVVFRSVFVSLLMIVTVALPVAVALGIGVLFFQVHPFNTVWSVKVEAYSWLVPEFSYTLCIALGLDYCVFIMTRVVEYKALGFTNAASVNKAVWKTGRVISFAGIIMMFSFGGMMFSNVFMMQSFGFIASIAVICDTFVVRPMVVPALMSILPDEVVWWPRKFDVPGTRDVNDMTEANDEDVDVDVDVDVEEGKNKNVDGNYSTEQQQEGDHSSALINHTSKEAYGTVEA